MSQQGENQLSQRRSQGDLSKLDNDSSLFESNHVCLSASDSALATSHLSSCNATSAGSNASNPPLLVDAVLSFIKAFCLKGDHGSIKRIVGERFSSESVDKANKLLWDYSKTTLESNGLCYHNRRDSDRRSQLDANLEDIMQALDVLDSLNLIPAMYCEAADLLNMPSLSLDPVSEQVALNSQALESLIATVARLDGQLSTLFTSSISTASSSSNQGCGSAEDSNTSYAKVASFTPPVPPTDVSNSSVLNVRQNKPVRQRLQSDGRDTNLVIFGLPESGSIVDDKSIVDEAFEFIVGNPVSINDMFRLGKYHKSSDTSSRVHVRPILVKISTAWERKLILLRKSRLRDFRTKYLFVREDVPPEHKLRQRRPKSRVESTVTSMPSTSNIPPTLPHSDDPHHCTHSSTPTAKGIPPPSSQVSPPSHSSQTISQPSTLPVPSLHPACTTSHVDSSNCSSSLVVQDIVAVNGGT